jgi:hypothetical protein
MQATGTKQRADNALKLNLTHYKNRYMFKQRCLIIQLSTARSTCGEMRNEYKILVIKPRRKRPLGIAMSTYFIKINCHQHLLEQKILRKLLEENNIKIKMWMLQTDMQNIIRQRKQ